MKKSFLAIAEALLLCFTFGCRRGNEVNKESAAEVGPVDNRGLYFV